MNTLIQLSINEIRQAIFLYCQSKGINFTEDPGIQFFASLKGNNLESLRCTVGGNVEKTDPKPTQEYSLQT